jgi:hypothetical protein
MKMKEEGLVKKNEQTGKWELVDDKNKTEVKDNSNVGKCIVCGADAPNGPQCKACYYETKEYREQMDKNSKLHELSNYYYNLNGNLYRMKDFNKIKSNCNKLYAIAILTKELYGSNTFTSKIENDIKNIIEKKQPKEDKITSEIDRKQDSQQEKIYCAMDGHNIKSQGEKIIDDVLFNNRIVHAYSPTVYEIDINEDRSVEADWFVPILSPVKGIYIEYYGKTTKSYVENKTSKIEAYKKYNIPVIQIQKDEPFESSNILSVRIMKEINSLSKEFYNYNWKV